MKAWRLITGCLLTCACLATLSRVALAAPGDLDRSFGGDGIVRGPQAFSSGHYYETTLGMAIGPNDEVIVLRAAAQMCAWPTPCTIDLALTRYWRDGVRDMGFGTDGVVVIALQPSGMRYTTTASVDVDHARRIVVAATDGPDIRLTRIQPDGQLDLGFGGGGSVTSDFGGRDTVAEVAVDPDGPILVSGATETEHDGNRPIVARYRSSGALDERFGNGGVASLGLAPGYSVGGLALLSRGRIALALNPCCYGVGRGMVARLLSDGELDRRFARRGWRPIGRQAPVVVQDLVPARRGRLLVVGSQGVKVFAARLLAGGALDQRYGRQGFAGVKEDWDGSRIEGALDRRGRLFMLLPHRWEAAGLIRLDTDGGRDRSFAGGTGTRVPGQGVGVGLQASGRVVVVGESGECIRACPLRLVVLSRFVGGDSQARCFGRRANVVGTRGSETLHGTPRPDVIQGFGGNDEILGLDGDDLLCGGAGNDQLSGGPGHDRLIGGPGGDYLHQQ